MKALPLQSLNSAARRRRRQVDQQWRTDPEEPSIPKASLEWHMSITEEMNQTHSRDVGNKSDQDSKFIPRSRMTSSSMPVTVSWRFRLQGRRENESVLEATFLKLA